MFYRYEVNKYNELSEWEGVFSAFNPTQRRRISRWLCEPKWYKKHLKTKSKCWFTDIGFQKYHEQIEKEIEEVLAFHSDWQIRKVENNRLDNLAMLGKIQCIQLLE